MTFFYTVYLLVTCNQESDSEPFTLPTAHSPSVLSDIGIRFKSCFLSVPEFVPEPKSHREVP